jgi:DNA polymerase III subunit alpha
MDFASLHTHSTFSFGDGYATPEQHIERVAELNMTAVGMTEHGNSSSHVQLEKAAKKHDIKPIFGCELYTGSTDPETRSRFKWHLTTLAMNAQGYRNLLQIVTDSWTDGFYFEPTVSGKLLGKYQDGLAVLSGCTGSKLAVDLIGGKGIPDHAPDLKAAARTAARFRDIFGDRYYLEIQGFPELEKTRTINPAYERIGRELGIPLIATMDVHYPHAADAEMQLILHASSRGHKTLEAQSADWEYSIPLTYPESDAQLVQKLVDSGLSKSAAMAAIENSAILAERCNVTLPRAEPLKYPGGEGMKTLREWCLTGWAARGLDRLSRPAQQPYQERIRRELGLIGDKQMADFFLVTADAVRWAKEQGIAVGVRGSAVASLACYLLGITEVDPLRYPAMMLERFIDPSRSDYPDIDLDVDDERRDEIRLYLEGKYGADHVGNISNWTRYRGRNSLDDVARVYNISRADVARLKEMVIDRGDGDARQAFSLEDTKATIPAAAAIFEAHPELNEALRLEGNLRGYGVHAGGLVVSTAPLSHLCAQYRQKSGQAGNQRDLSVLSLDKRDAEYLGALKIDLLGLKTMGMVSTACRLAGVTLEDLYALPDDDPRVMQAFRDDDVTGIFQFTERATRNCCREVQPVTFMELADLTALSRPGPLLSGSTAAYIHAGRKVPAFAKDSHGPMRAITEATRGQLVYQEQLLKVATDIGGFSWEEASKLRKIIHKKLGKAQFMALFSQFAKGAWERHRMSDKQSGAIWKAMSEAAAYAFNIAHAVSYAKLAYWCMWLKQYHADAFFTASLRKAKDADVTLKLLRDAIAHDIQVSPPHFARSQANWTLDGQQRIRAGFEQVPGIGQAVSTAILAEREREPFTRWADLARVPGVGPKTIALLEGFATSADPFGLDKAREAIAVISKAARYGRLPVPVPDCDSTSLRSGTSGTEVVYCGIVRKVEYRDLAEDERAAGNPELKGVKRPDLTRSATVKCYDTGDEDVYIRISRFVYDRFADDLKDVSPGDAVVVRGRKTDGMGLAVRADRMWTIEI